VAFESLGKIVRGHLLSNLRTVLDSRMTLGFLDHLVSLPYSFFQLRSAGDLITRLNSNSVVREHLTSSTLSGILDGLMVVIYLGILVVGSRAMALAAALAGALDVVVYLLCRGRQRELVTQALRAETKSHSYQVEMMTAMETLKATGCEHRAVTHWSNIFVDEVNVSLQRDRLSIRVDALVAAIRTLGPLGILATGTVHVLNGDLTLGTMLSLSAVAGSFLEPLARLVQTAMSLEVLRSYLERVNDVLQTDPEDRRSAVRRAPPLSGRIALDHVSFRYTADGPLVVDDVSLEIRPRQVVAIVGRSGAGKSTLANLILGLYRPSSGRILFDQFDLAGLDLRSVRQQFGIVNQNVSLFASTVRDNISLADPSMSLESVQKAARRACIHDDVEAMPLGYSTLLGDRGSSLSGGQRQRLALARALVREPAVLLLDEATSALDAATERKVQQSLDLLECTRVIIAHRLSTVRRADLILVMEKGRLVEVGDHATLVARGGHYAALVASQLESDGPGRLPA
jgi:ABC-type bacteriocin/lantibiotic exporter with double-glycine peptidase domain